MKKTIYFIAIAISALLLMQGCKKNDPMEKPVVPTYVNVTLKASEGGTLQSSDSKITMTIPADALPADATVAVGIKGNESKESPNPQLKILGQPFTITLPADTLYKPVKLTFPKPEGYKDFEKTIVYAFDGKSFFPMYYKENGNNLEVEIDVVKWISFSKQQNNIQKSPSVSHGYGQGDIVIGVGTITPMPDDMPNVPKDEQLFGLYRFDRDDIIDGKYVIRKYVSTQITSPVDENHKILLMIHGWNSGTYTWYRFLDKFNPLINSRSKSGYTDYWVFGYNSSLPIKENGKKLADLLKTYIKGAEVDIVSHSMGGLVSRYAIENQDCESIINHLMMLGTPNFGSPMEVTRALFTYGLNMFNEMEKMNVSLPAGGSDIALLAYSISTDGAKDLSPKSDFINQLSSNKSSDVPYFAVAAINQPTWWLFSTLTLPGDDDGVVTVISAKGSTGYSLKKTNKEIHINANIAHIEMTGNDDVINAVLDYLNTNSPKTRVTTDEAYDILLKMKMPVYGGVNPPKINGSFLISPFEMRATNIENDGYPVGQIVNDEIVQITPLQGNLVSVRTRSKTQTSESKTAKIVGEGKNFTIYLQSRSFNGSDYIDMADIYSGTLDNGAIKNLSHGFVCLDDSHRGATPFVTKGNARIFFDNDFETKATTWDAPFNMPKNINGKMQFTSSSPYFVK